MRKIDIAHSGQSVPEAMAQLVAAIKYAKRDGEEELLVVHGFGASGIGGLIKEAVAAELPRLARTYGFKAFGDADRSRMPREPGFDSRRINQGASLLVFKKRHTEQEEGREFRPNYRNMKRVVVPPPPAAPGQKLSGCRHADRQLLSRGPSGNTYRCRTCAKTFLVYG